MSDVPSTPSIVIRPVALNQSLQFFWGPPNSNTVPIDAYVLSNTIPAIQEIYSPSTFITTIGSLDNRSSYTFSLSASNAAGLGPAATFRTVQPGNKPPYSCYNIKTDILTASTAMIQWEDPFTNDGGADVKWHTIVATPSNNAYPVVKKGAPAYARQRYIAGLNPNTTYSFKVFTVNDPGYSPFNTFYNGLITNVYTSGYFNDDPTWFLTQTPAYTVSNTTDFTNISSSTNGYIPLGGSYDYYSVEWKGLFYCQATGSHTFYTVSDDASYLWIGSNAVSGYTTSNALVQNGGIHDTTEVSSSITLTAGRYYPIRIQYGESDGGDDCSVSVSTPTLARTPYFNNLFFNA
jgi:hypothetical protein